MSHFRTPAIENWTRAWTTKVAARSTPPLESAHLATSCGSTHVLRTADGPADRGIVCLPGFGASAAFWAVASQLEPLARVAPVAVVDLPGHPGLSAGTPLPLDAPQLTGWLRELIEGLGFREADVVGVSLGGFLTVRASPGLPGLVRRTALLAPAGVVPPLPTPRMLRILWNYQRNSSRESTEAFVDHCLLGDVQPLDEEARSEVVWAMHQWRQGFANRSRLPIHLLDRDLAGLGQETLLLVGDSDPVFSARGTIKRVRRLTPGLREHRRLTAHGHQLELSRRSIEHVASFLGE